MAATDYCDYWVWRRYQYTRFSVRRAGQGCRWALSQQQNNFCSNVDGGTGEALSKTLTSCRLLMCVFLIKPSDPDSMRVAWQYSIFYWDLCSQLSIVQLNWHSPENTSAGRSTTVAVFTSQKRAGSHWASVTEAKESGKAVTNITHSGLRVGGRRV